MPAPDPVNPLAFESIVPSDLGVTLNWIADSGSTFVVEFSDVIPPNWSSSVPVTSDTGEFSYLDSGEADGINSPTRYYRLREIAP